jgi:hypothetical protein
VTRTFAIVGALVALLLPRPAALSTSGPVIVERVPDGGLVPQAVTDHAGGVHLVYFTGDPTAGDLYHTTRLADGGFAPPVRVNTRPASAIALGSVRGAQIAVGPSGSIHVVWNGSDPATTAPRNGRPLFYSRSTDGGTTFAAERNLITWATGLDGGGSIAAGQDRRVYAVWHATPAGASDAQGAVYVARSDDEGVHFGTEARVGPADLGACGCCSIRARVDTAGTLFVLYRAAGQGVHRDMTLLASSDAGRTFAATRLDPWEIAACPLSSMSLADGPHGLVAAWETRGHVRVAQVTPTVGAVSEPDGPTRPDRRKHPVIAFNRAGESIVAWLDGTGWAKGGSVAWQVYDAAGRPTAQGSAPGVPVWGLVAVAALPDGRFAVFY